MQGRSDETGGAGRSCDGDWGVSAIGQEQWIPSDDPRAALRDIHGSSCKGDWFSSLGGGNDPGLTTIL